MRALVGISLALVVTAPAHAAEPAASPAGVSTTLVLRDGHVTYTVAPRVSADERFLVLLAFPSGAPDTRPLPPAAVDALHAVAALELPPEGGVRAVPSSKEQPDTKVALFTDRAGFEEWARAREGDVDEAARARGVAFLEAGWKVIAISGDATSPAFGFRFRSERPFVPPDLLTLDDETQRALLGAAAANAGAPDAQARPDDDDNRLLRLLDKIWGD